MAKDLVRTKQYVKKFILMKANIQAVSLKITTLKSQDAMMNAMKGVTKVYIIYVGYIPEIWATSEFYPSGGTKQTIL